MLILAPTRRHFAAALLGVIASVRLPTPQVATAACLPHDDSVDCIGVYKEWGDIAESDARAAGVRWLPREKGPSTYKEALGILHAQRSIVATFDSNQDLVDVGRSLLRVRPRVTLAANELQRRASPPTGPLFDLAVERTLFALDALDVAIGFAIRASSTNSFLDTLEIVDALRTAESEFDTLIRFAEDSPAFRLS